MGLRKVNHEIVFMAGVAVYLIILMIAGSGLSEASLEFPKIIIGVALGIIGLKLLVTKFRRLKFFDPGASVENIVRRQTEQVFHGEPKEISQKSSRYKSTAFILWLISLPLGAYLIGFMQTLVLWLFFFLLVLSRTKFLKTLIICLCTFGWLYLVFVGILKISFSPGILFQ